MKRSFGWLGVLLLTFGVCLNALAGPAEEQLNKAKALYNSGKFEEAIQVYKDLLSKQKDELKNNSNLAADVWQGLGEALLRAGKSSEAQKAFERVAAHRARKPEIPSKSEKAGQTNVPVVPTVPGVEELTSSSNQEVKDYFRAAMSFVAQGSNLGTAILYLLEASRKEPENQTLLSKTALLILDHSETHLKTARTMLTKLNGMKKGKMTPEEMIGYARTLYLVAPFEYKEAEKILDSILKTDPKNVKCLLAMAELDIARGKFDKALQGFQKVKEISPKEPRALWGIGYALRGQGKINEAFSAFQAAFELFPDDATNNARMGKAMLSLKKEAIATKHFYRALDLDPDNIDANLGLIPLLLKDSEDMTARKYLDKVAEIDPGNPQYYFCKGMWAEMRGNIHEAVNYYELASAYGPENVEAKLKLARIYLGIGNDYPGKVLSSQPMVKKTYNLFYSSAKALKVLKEVMEVAPNHPESGWVAQQIDNLEAKRQTLTQDQN